ncbi:CAP domain-containing protein [Gottfriedia acidiceleris]|uniref:CAP domain-containing protein n=1 Tax=Gottfriedia acidiceleris TaxID=371036 RepID=UPI000B430AED|nr:CAP domain-containing protein [Gottfriedia acidiceleris]
MNKTITLSVLAGALLIGSQCSKVSAATTKKVNYTKVNYKGQVTAKTLKVHSGIGTKYKVVGKLTKGKTVKVTRKSNQWVYITSGKTKGWTSVKYVKKVTIKKPVTKPSTPTYKPTTTTTTNQTTSTSTALSVLESKVVELTNVERSKAGLKPFKVNNELSKLSRIKSQEMTDKNYFDHNSPTYGSPFDMMKKFNIAYKSAAENIAKGQKTPEEVVKAWMNSAGHRANILNGNLDQIGVGYDSRSNAWTQMFISQ